MYLLPFVFGSTKKLNIRMAHWVLGLLKVNVTKNRVPKINFTFLNNTIYDWPNFTKNLAPLFLFFHFLLLILSGNVFSLSHLAFAHFWILKSLRSFAKMGIISSYRYRLLGILSSQIPEFLAAHSTIHERERERYLNQKFN